MLKKENVNQDVKNGFGLIFTTGKKFDNTSNIIFESLFVQEVPNPTEIMEMLVSVYEDLESGLDMPTSVSDLYCHVYRAVGNDGYLKVDVNEHITSFGGLLSNVL